MIQFVIMYLTKRGHHLDKKVNTMKNYILATILLSISSFSFDAAANYIEHYSVEQKHITVKVAPTSGLNKALCYFYDASHNKIDSQIVTISEQWDNITIIEVNFSEEKHNQVNFIECK